MTSDIKSLTDDLNEPPEIFYDYGPRGRSLLPSESDLQIFKESTRITSVPILTDVDERTVERIIFFILCFVYVQLPRLRQLGDGT